MLLRPKVTLVSEITLDGKLTVTRGSSSKLLMQFMSHEADVLLHTIRAESDAIMVGANTIRIDNSFLTVRHVKGNNPIRVIPSRKGEISPDSNVFSPDAQTIIAVTNAANPDNINEIKKKGAVVEVCGKTEIDLQLLMNRLYENHNIRTLMIEGGSTLNGLMFKGGLIDRIVLIHLPFIAGNDNTPSLVSGLNPNSVDELVHVKLEKSYLAGDNLISEYQVIKREN